MRYLEKQKSGIYRYRRDVPEDIQDCIGLKRLKRSLMTKDENAAIEKWKSVDTEINNLFKQCRLKPKGFVMSEKALQTVASNLGAEILAKDETDRVRAYSALDNFDRFPFMEHNEAVKARPEDAVVQQAGKAWFAIQDLKLALAMDSYDDLDDETESRILSKLKEAGHKGKIPPKIFRTFVEAELLAQEGILARCKGDSVPTPDLVPVDASTLSVKATKFSDEKKQLGEWNDKTGQTASAAIRLFCEICGDKDISEYRKDDARKFKSILVKYPANVWKFPELKGMTPDQIVKAGKPPMSSNNASKIFSFVGSFFRYAVQSYDAMISNPFEGQGIKKKSNEDSRSPFTIEDLNKMFRAPLYHGVKSPRFWSKSGDVSMRNTGKFWIPLIGLFTGMRLSEIVQLQVSDIQQKDEIWIFDVCRGDDKSFKTGAAIRQIPVHNDLIKCGLLEHIEQCKGHRLFPEIRRSRADATYSFNFSKYFNAQFLKSVGVKREGIVFHSFRHLYEEACMNTGMQDSMVDMLQGHKLEKMKAVYVSNLDLKRKDKYVQKIRYEGLDLEHLHVD